MKYVNFALVEEKNCKPTNFTSFKLFAKNRLKFYDFLIYAKKGIKQNDTRSNYFALEQAKRHTNSLITAIKLKGSSFFMGGLVPKSRKP